MWSLKFGKAFLFIFLFLFTITTAQSSNITLPSGGGGDTFGGADEQVQFLDSGSPGVDADFNWTLATNVLSLELLELDGCPIAGPCIVSISDDSAVDATKAANLRLQGANKTAGTGDGGDLDLRAGTSSGGTKGDVLVDATTFAVTGDITASGTITAGSTIVIDGTAETISVPDDSVADANKAADLTLRASNKTAGTGDGGDLDLTAGTSSGGTQGNIILTANGVGIGQSAPNVPFVVGSNNSNGSGNGLMKVAQDNFTPAANETMIDIKSDVNVSIAAQRVEAMRIEMSADITNPGTVAKVAALTIQSDAEVLSGSLTDHFGLDVSINARDSGTITNSTTLRVGQTWTESDGVGVAKVIQITGGGGPPSAYFAISQEDAAADNAFNGDTRFGSTTAPTTGIEVDITGDLSASGEVIIGSPTGGGQGAGTINATGVFDDGVLLTDYVFEPGYDQKTIDEMQEFYEVNKHLPTIKGRDAWEKKRFSLGKVTTMLWETIEVQAIYIAELDDKQDALEERIWDLEQALLKLADQ